MTVVFTKQGGSLAKPELLGDRKRIFIKMGFLGDETYSEADGFNFGDSGTDPLGPQLKNLTGLNSIGNVRVVSARWSDEMAGPVTSSFSATSKKLFLHENGTTENPVDLTGGGTPATNFMADGRVLSQTLNTIANLDLDLEVTEAGPHE